MGETFVDALHWCDRWCERCPLAAARCKLAAAEAARRADHEARGDDPDDPVIVDADFAESLAEAHRLVDRLAREAGIDPNEPPQPEPVVSIAVARMQKLSTAFAMSTRHAVRALPEPLDQSELAVELRHQALIFAQKCARLVDHFDERGHPRPGGEPWATDAVPNLLLLDELDRRLMETMNALFLPSDERDSLFGVYAELRRALAPLRAAVPEEARVELASMIERGDAPSPFCVIPE